MNNSVRHTEIEISYTNSRTKKAYKLNPYIEELNLTDSAIGDGDTVEISLNDHDNKLLFDYYPGIDDMLRCLIILHNIRSNKNVYVSNESFHVDKIGYSDMPATFSISAISVPKNSTFSKTPKTKTWTNVDIFSIASKICSTASISLFWETGTPDYSIKKIEQSNSTDLSFLYSICQTFGLGMKIYSNKLVIFSEEKYEKKAAVMTVKRNQILEGTFSANFELVRAYTGFIFEYTSNNVETRQSLYFITKPEIFVDIGECDSYADGMAKGKARVNQANKNLQTVTFEMLGDHRLIATSTFNLSGYGGLDGKYYVNKVTHKFSASSGYTQEIEARRIQQRL